MTSEMGKAYLSKTESHAHAAAPSALGFTTALLLLAAGLVLSVTVAVMLRPVAVAPGTVWRVALSHLPWLDSA